MKPWLLLCLVPAITAIAAAALAPPVIDTWPKTEMRQLVDRVDDLLGGSRSDDNKTTSTLRLTGSEQISRAEPPETEFNIRFTLKLGLLERWQQELQDWSQKEINKVKEDIREDFTKEKTAIAGEFETTKGGASTQSKAPRPPPKDPWRFSLEKHVTVARRPDFWAHARARKDWEGQHLLQTVSAEIGWSLKQKWESLFSAVTSTRLAQRWALSFGNQVQWLLSDKTFSTSHGPSLSYMPGDNQVMSLGAGVSTAVDGGRVWFADGYSVNAGYRLAAWKEWLMVSVNPSLNFAKAHRFYGDPGLFTSVELVF